MGTIDDKFILRLDAFIDSLGGVVELLKEQTNKSDIDPVNRLLSNMDNRIEDIVKNIEELIISNNEKIEKNNVEIQRLIKDFNKDSNELNITITQSITDTIKSSFGVLTDNVVKQFVQLKEDIIKNINKELSVKLDKKDKTKNKRDDKTVDVLEKIKNNTDVIINSNSDISQKTDTIIKGIEDIKKSKETGMMDKIADTDNKKKIIDAVKTIVLIASGVLAIGLAFKIIGKVDIMSVMAIGAAIGIMTAVFTYAYKKLKEDKFNIKDSYMLSGVLLIMSSTILLSSFILSNVQTLSLKDVVSITLIAGVLGTSLYLLSKSFKNIKLNKDNMKNFFILPIIAPIIALSIVISSHIFNKVSLLSLKEVISITFTSVALGVALYTITKSIKNIKLEPKDIKNIFLLPIIIPIIAMGIVVSSYIFSSAKPISLKDIISITFTSVALGVALYGIGKVISKFDFTDKKTYGNILLLPIIIPTIALGIVISSHIFKSVALLSFKDILGVIGTSAAIFVISLGIKPLLKNIKGIDKKDIINLFFIIPTISLAVVAASWILKNVAPFTLKESLYLAATGLAIAIVTTSFVPLVLLMKKVEKKDIQKSLFFIPLLSLTVVVSSWILSIGKYDKYPSKDWIMGVGLSLLIFGGTVLALSLMLNKVDEKKLFNSLGLITGISLVIVATSYILSLGYLL